MKILKVEINDFNDAIPFLLRTLNGQSLQMRIAEYFKNKEQNK